MNQQQVRKGNKRRGERGSILATASIGMVSLVLATGLAIDISHLYTAKAELQNAADAAALAAASQLSSTSGGITMAVAEATKALNKYNFGNNVAINGSDITFSNNLNGTYVDQSNAESNPTNIRFVKVALSPKPVGITFAALVTANPQNIRAQATAGMSIGLGMNKFYTAYTFIESTGAPLVKGNSYILDPKNGNDSSPTSYRVLAGPDGDLILTGTVHAYGYIGSSYTVANLVASEMCRYAKIGMNTRFGDYSVHPGTNPTDEPPDTVTTEGITYAQYRTDQPTSTASGMKNRRILTLPIAMNTAYNTGSRTVVANRLAGFFVKRKVGPDCKLHVEYIGAPMAVPVGTYAPGNTQMPELTIPVLYK
ncbi:MAG: pilus assembly protein TadG-related protein [Pyrinomonadaceae bacterium]